MKRFLLLLTAAACLMLLVGCQQEEAPVERITLGEFELPTADELAKFDLLIRNSSCTDVDDKRTVDASETEFIAQMAELCLQIEPFRPTFVLFDMKLGVSDNTLASLFFRNDEIQYSFNFFDVRNQTDINYEHRDAPVISVGIAPARVDGAYHNQDVWYCTMDPADYMTLYKAAKMYSDGELTE